MGNISGSSVGKREVARKQREICTVKDIKGVESIKTEEYIMCQREIKRN